MTTSKKATNRKKQVKAKSSKPKVGDYVVLSSGNDGDVYRVAGKPDEGGLWKLSKIGYTWGDKYKAVEDFEVITQSHQFSYQHKLVTLTKVGETTSEGVVVLTNTVTASIGDEIKDINTKWLTRRTNAIPCPECSSGYGHTNSDGEAKKCPACTHKAATAIAKVALEAQVSEINDVDLISVSAPRRPEQCSFKLKVGEYVYSCEKDGPYSYGTEYTYERKANYSRSTQPSCKSLKGLLSSIKRDIAKKAEQEEERAARNAKRAQEAKELSDVIGRETESSYRANLTKTVQVDRDESDEYTIEIEKLTADKAKELIALLKTGGFIKDEELGQQCSHKSCKRWVFAESGKCFIHEDDEDDE